MNLEFRVFLGDNGLLPDLREWMTGLPGVDVRAVERPPEPHGQGTVWDFLAVVCAAGGPVAAAVRALQLWVEARVTTVEVKIGDRLMKIKSQDAKELLPQVLNAVRALEQTREAGDEPA